MKRGLYFASGLLVGMALFGGGTAYAAGLMASPSSQTFYVAGQQVYLQAYAIGGNNYVKLRDIGQAVDFGVTYSIFILSIIFEIPVALNLTYKPVERTNSEKYPIHEPHNAQHSQNQTDTPPER